jgi:hypothetical protein
VTALPGGPADKVGNQYEHWWTARVVGELLLGAAHRLRLEPPGKGGVGIEFEVNRGGVSWGEQVKLRSGNWTITKLVQEGVLDGALAQVQRGRHFRLIVSSTATPFDTLTNRSRDCFDANEYVAALSSDDEGDFIKLAKAWGVEQDQAFTFLRSIWVEVHPFENLRELVSAEFRLLFSNEPTVVLGEIRNYCEDHMHEVLTANQVWSHLESKGFCRRHLAGDQRSITGLRKTVERHARHVGDNRPDIGLVPSSYSGRLRDVLTNPDGKQLVVLHGNAGFGKSTIVAEVAAELQAAGWFVAAANMSLVDSSAVTSTKLGDQLGLGDNSAAVVLAGVADGGPGLLVIDQLDAVGTYSGRITAVYDAISEMLDELAPTPNIKVLVVARTVDLESDSRFRRFRDAKVADRVQVGRLTADDVLAKLSDSGVPLPASDVTMDLLRTPLHLSIFLRLSEDAQREQYPSLQGLYDRYTAEVRQTVEVSLGHLAWSAITGALVNYMNDNQRLSAPGSILDGFAVDEVHALESADVLSLSDRDVLSFFHESYFDYLFARMFVSSDKDLFEFVVDSGQELFRRAQVRQVLEHLLATDRSKFRAVVQQMLTSDKVRSHLKEVVVDVAAQADATSDDWIAIDEAAWSHTPVAWRVLGLLGRPSWFAAADSLGKWEEWLADPDKVNKTFNELRFLARDHFERVEELVRPYVGANDDWRLRLKSMIEWSVRSASTDFAIELLERGDLDDARGPIAVNSDFWSIVFGLGQDDPPSAARFIGAYLKRSLVRARADGSEDPFASGHLRDFSPSDKVISDVATKAPREYLASVLDFVEVVAVANQSVIEGSHPVGGRWGYRYPHSHSVDDKIFEGVAKALSAITETDPDLCRAYIARLSAHGSGELCFLACTALTVLGPADEAIAWLVDDPRNLELGYADNSSWASRSLIARWSGDCTDELFNRLEALVLSYAPVWETRARGASRLRLLSALEPSRLSDVGRRQLGELERRFPDMDPEQAPRGVIGGSVGSPISDAAGEKMSDAHWLRALHKYASLEMGWRGEQPVGGARELAQMLGRRAEKDPVRFANLALGFDTDVHASAMDAVLRAVTSKLEGELLAELCEHAKRTFGPEVGRTICWAVHEADPISDRMARVVATYVDDPDPAREWAKTQASSGANHFGGKLDSAGLNSTRGQVARVASMALFQSADHLDVIRPVVKALAVDPVLCVRAFAAEAVLALMNYEPELAYDLSEALLDADLDLYDTRGVERLMRYLLFREPNRFARFLARALAGPEPAAERAGHLWALLAFRDSLPPDVPQHSTDLSVAARRGAATSCAHNATESAALLIPLFDDPDEEVRKQAASSMTYLGSLSHETVATLTRGFLPSQAFEENFDDLIENLESVESIDGALALEVCERAITVAGAEFGDIRTARSMHGQPVMVTLLRVYREGDNSQRQRCLDVIDHLSEFDAYGLADALNEMR